LSEEWWEDLDEYNPCEDDEALDNPEECGIELEDDEPIDFDEELYEEFEEEEL